MNEDKAGIQNEAIENRTISQNLELGGAVLSLDKVGQKSKKFMDVLNGSSFTCLAPSEIFQTF